MGDLSDSHNISLSLDKWADILLQYEDGRFANDIMWSFYVSNYLTRRRNQMLGAFFVKTFFLMDQKLYQISNRNYLKVILNGLIGSVILQKQLLDPQVSGDRKRKRCILGLIIIFTKAMVDLYSLLLCHALSISERIFSL